MTKVAGPLSKHPLKGRRYDDGGRVASFINSLNILGNDGPSGEIKSPGKADRNTSGIRLIATMGGIECLLLMILVIIGLITKTQNDYKTQFTAHV